MQLTLHQNEKNEDIIKSIKEGNKRILLTGSAGVGKTTLTEQLIYAYRKHIKKWGTIYITAPTHKALGVLRSKIKAESFMEFATIHSALKLKRKIEKDGTESYIKSKYNPRYPPLQGCTMLIIDEASMLGVGILNILEEVEFKNILIIFVGDYKQLNPVKEENSPVFLLAELSSEYERSIEIGATNTTDAIWQEARKMTPVNSKTLFDLKILKYKTVELTEIVRQGKDNPIIDLSYSVVNTFSKLLSRQDNTFTTKKVIRTDFTEEQIKAKVNELIDNPWSFVDEEGEEKNYTEEEVEYTGGYVYTNDRTKIIERLAEVNGTDEIKYLSWTNADVDAMNKDVRERIYGLAAKKIEVNEIIVLNAPYGEFHTNEEVRIDEVIECEFDFIQPNENSEFSHTEGLILVQKPLRDSSGKLIYYEGTNDLVYNFDKLKLKVYRALVASVNRKEEITGYVNIIHEDSQYKFNEAAKQVTAYCVAGLIVWDAKYYFNEQILDYKYNHAITVHRSQGSTYKKVIINVGNLNANKNLAEKKRLFYTAITRASELVILYNVK